MVSSSVLVPLFERVRFWKSSLEHYRTYLQKAQQGTLDHRIRPSGRPRTVQPDHEQQLLNQLDTHPDATLQEHASMLHKATGLKISYRTVDRVFRRHGITHKKRTHRQRT
ncbi:helix-turn-helix domain-containing protein [Deinococcus cavernae]